MKRIVFVLGLSLLVVSGCNAQTSVPQSSANGTLAELQREMPSEREFSELLAKADEKVSMFETAVKNARPGLDRIDTKYASNYLDAAATAHLLISETLKNGPTAYRLVGILTTLDDLSLDAANSSAFLLASSDASTKRASPDPNRLAVLAALSSAGASCNDISELIFHSTMRLIGAEETALNKLLEGHN